jgi:hypothetical protein
MPQLSHPEAAAILRAAVTALSARLTTEFGDLVPDASAERTSAVLAKLESSGEPSALDGSGSAPARLTHDEVTTLDSWIRLADSAVLHDDTVEAEARVDIASRLREVRALVAPEQKLLSEDTRETQQGA